LKSLVLSFALLLSSVTQAATIDFDSLPDGGWHIGGGYYEVASDGFYFGSLGGVGSFGEPGNKGMVGNGSGIEDPGFISMGKQGGGSFALVSADISNAVSWSANTETGSFNSSTASGPSLNDIGTGAWLNITSLTIYGPSDFTSVTLDNVVVGAAVPVPAAVWLFGSALAGLGWMRRKPAV